MIPAASESRVAVFPVISSAHHARQDLCPPPRPLLPTRGSGSLRPRPLFRPRAAGHQPNAKGTTGNVEGHRLSFPADLNKNR